MNTMLKYSKFALAGVALAGMASAAQAVELNVVSWGGAYTASQMNAYHKPYSAKTGVTINSLDYSGGLAELRAQTEAGNVTWDLVDVVLADAITGCDEGIFRLIDIDKEMAAAPDGTPASKDFFEGTLLSECFIPQIIYSTAFAYRTDAFGGKNPSTMADVFDTKNFPGKRTLQKSPKYNLEWALIADGVPVSDVYDVLDTDAGKDRAFKKLATIKNDVIWWTEGAVPAQLLADGEVVFGTGYNGRLFSAIVEEKQPLAMIWDGQALDIDGWAVPAKGKNVAEVMKYLYFATDTQRLADQAKYISYGPARQSSAPMVSTHATLGIEMAPHMPTQYADQGFMTGFSWWADNGDEMNQRFAAWLLQ
ncbi:MAG: ABC transporter substrate-binding protein [Rhodospirillales bacterium]|nr:ABC transporter substrate-binding protein [Rhodospirillales bacterium]